MGIFGDVWNAATDVADAAVDVVGAAAASAGGAVGAVGNAVDSATGGAASGLMDVIDDNVLDAIDDMTNGVVDIDFDDGNFSAAVGIAGVAQAGASVGEDGVSAEADSLLAGAELSATDDGLNTGFAGGVDWGPLPYAEANVAIDGDGDVAFDSRVQGTIPTQYGLVSGKAEAGFVRDGENWGGRVDAEGTLRTVDGSVFSAGVEVAYAETEDGSVFNLGLEGSYGRTGMGTVGGSVGYQRIEDGETVIEGFEGEVYVEAYGERIEAGAEYVGVDTPDGSFSQWDTHIGDGRSADAVAPQTPPSPTGIGSDGTPPTTQTLIAPTGINPDGPAIQPRYDAAPTEETSLMTNPATVAQSDHAEVPSPIEIAPEPEITYDPEPTSFDTAIAAADDIEDSVNDLFSDFG